MVMTMPLWAQEPEPEPPVITTVVDTLWTKDYKPTEYHAECSNHLPWMWRSKDLRQTGVYHDTTITTTYKKAPIPAVVLQDTTLHDTLTILSTIYTMEFTVNPTFSIERTYELRKGSRVEIRGKWYTEAGTYYDTIPSSTTCDSILHITIIWAENYRQVETLYMCEGGSTQWRGKTLYKEGIYWDSLKTQQGYDSVYQCYLYVYHPFVKYDTLRLCDTDTASFLWHDIPIDRPGDYSKGYIDRHGCDSTYYLHYQVYTSSASTIYTNYFCRNQGFVYQHTTYYTQKTFTDTLLNELGCDSVVVYRFIPRDNTFHSETIQHYPGVPVVWRDSSYVIDSIYQDTLVNQYGCDSIMELRLIPKYDIDVEKIRCEGDTIMLRHMVIDHNCDINDTLKALMGGDSIIHLHFSFKKPFHNREEITICSNEYVEWTGHNQILHAPGIYYDRHRTKHGCDSTYEILVRHSPAYLHDSVVIICNDSNDINPVSWTDSKGKVWTFHRHNIDTMVIDTMHHTEPVERHYDPTYQGDPISGGCDSIFRFRVIVTDRCSQLDTIPICPGGAAWVDGRLYTEPGLYCNKMPSKLHPELDLPDSTHTFLIWQAPTDTTYDTATICQSKLPLYYHGKPYASTDSADYQVVLTNRYGCDSVVNLHINVIPTLFSPVNYIDDYCPGDSIFVKTPTGKIFTRPGTYTDTVHYCEYGCDSIILIQIAYKPSYFNTETKYLKPGETFCWRGHRDDIVLDSAGVYYDSCVNVFGCDSVYQLKLIYAESFYKEETAHVCNNQLPLIWHRKTINEEGVYWDSLKTIYKLDSVYKLTVALDSAFYDTLTYQLCEGDVFTLKGKKYYTSGIYIDKLSSVGGCDSIVYHIVSFSTALVQNKIVVHCPKDSSVWWRGKWYNRPGTYFDTLRTTIGCDSILYSMQLKVDYPFYHEDSVRLCHSELPLEWHNRKITMPGVYWDSCKTIYQMDSVYRLKVDTLPDSFTSYTVSICKDSTYNFGAEVISKPGVYIRHMVSANGCDSAIRCIVNTAPQYLYDEVMSYIDDSELPLYWHGKTLDHEGWYYDSLQTVGCHCDSIHRLHLTKNQRYFFSEEKQICDCELPLSWHGMSLTESGIYTQTYTTKAGVDSVYQIDLTVNMSELEVKNVLLCEGQTYSLHGWKLTQPGIYRDTMYNEQGCYFITEVRISRPEQEETMITHLLCPGDSIQIDGKNITTAGNYYVTTQSLITGCDSVIHHVVTLSTAFFQQETKIIRQGETYIWHQQGQPVVLSEQGTYFDSCRNVHGCDSIYRLELIVDRVEYIFPTEYVTVCDYNLPYVWHQQSITQEGTYWDKHKTILGGDSIYTLQLRIATSYDSTSYLNFCEGEHPTINGNTYSRSASFIDTLTSKAGCDSVRIQYILNFYPRYSLTKMIELKNGEVYIFGDTTIATSGIYFRHFYTEHGCDSLVTLHVAACPTMKETIITKDLCEGETFTLNGQVITTSGRYTTYLQTADGCDSIVTYAVNFHPSFNDYRAVSICNGQSYTWHRPRGDTTLTRPGVYIDSIPTESGCYNTYTLQLSFKNNDWSDTLITLCWDKVPYTYKGKHYYTDSVFYDTLGTTMSSGCDSILRWHYQINYHCSLYDQYKRCSNETKYIDGLLINKAGVYSVNHITAHGEDSLYRFIVNDVQPYEHFTPIADACDSVVYQGVTYLARGKGKESFQVDLKHRTVEGCDSIEHLMLTIYSSSPKYTETATIADYQTYRFENQTYNTSGTHTVKHLNQHNCDSIRELILTVLPTTYHVPDTFAFCKGDKSGLYIFKKWYFPTQDTIIRDTTWASGQPHIYTALVNRHYPFVISSIDVHPERELCSQYIVPFELDYTVEATSAMPEYFEYYFVEQDLEVKHDTITQAINGKTTLQLQMDGRGIYVQPGYYTFRILFRSLSCEYADTSFIRQVMVRYPQDIMEAGWNNVVMLVNENYNENGWIFTSPYAWQVHNYAGGDKTAQVVPSDHSQPYIASDHLQDGDQVVALLYRKGYAKPIPSCTFTFTPQAYNPAADPILVYPTVTSKSSQVHVKTCGDGQYHIYGTTGDRCGQGIVHDGDNTILMPASAGCYLMHVSLQDGTTALERVMVY